MALCPRVKPSDIEVVPQVKDLVPCPDPSPEDQAQGAPTGWVASGPAAGGWQLARKPPCCAGNSSTPGRCLPPTFLPRWPHALTCRAQRRQTLALSTLLYQAARLNSSYHMLMEASRGANIAGWPVSGVRMRLKTPLGQPLPEPCSLPAAGRL